MTGKSLRLQSLYNGHSPEEEFGGDVAVLTGQFPGGLDQGVVSADSITASRDGSRRRFRGHHSCSGLHILINNEIN